MPINGSWADQFSEDGVAALLAERLRRLGVPILDGASVRWDAAERCLVVVAEGREVRVR